MLIAKFGLVEPNLDSLGRFPVEWHPSFLFAFATDFDDLVATRHLDVTDPHPTKLTDAASGVGQHRQQRSIADAFRSLRIGRIEHLPAFRWRQADCLSIAGHRRRRYQVAMGWVDLRKTVDLKV